MKLYRTTDGPVLELDGAFYKLTDDWDALVNYEALSRHDGRRAPIRSREVRKLPHIRCLLRFSYAAGPSNNHYYSLTVGLRLGPNTPETRSPLSLLTL